MSLLDNPDEMIKEMDDKIDMLNLQVHFKYYLSTYNKEHLKIGDWVLVPISHSAHNKSNLAIIDPEIRIGKITDIIKGLVCPTFIMVELISMDGGTKPEIHYIDAGTAYKIDNVRDFMDKFLK